MDTPSLPPPSPSYDSYIIAAYGVALVIIGWMWIRSTRLERRAKKTLSSIEGTIEK